MRKLLVAILVLVLLGVVAEVAARRLAEDRVASRLQRTFDLSSEPSVEIGGAPFLLELVRGDISELSMSSENVRSEDVTLDEVNVDMRNVRFSISDLMDGSGTVRVGDADGAATIGEASINDALEGAGVLVNVTLGAQGVTAASAETALEVPRADLSLEGGALVLSASDLSPVTIDLPSLGGRVTYDELSTSNGRAKVTFTVENLRLST